MASSEYFKALLTFCSTINTVVPWSASFRSNLKTSCTTIGDRPIEGSSINKTFGRNNSARPISSCFCSPPDKEAAAEFMRSFTRGKNSSTSGMRSCVVFIPKVMPPSSRFSNTESWPNKLRPCGTKAMPLANKSFWLAPVISSPFKKICPCLGVSNPNKVLRTVDLPAPLGPINKVIDPVGTLNDKSLRIMKSL